LKNLSIGPDRQAYQAQEAFMFLSKEESKSYGREFDPELECLCNLNVEEWE